MDGLTNVYHKSCGGHVGYVADINKLKSDSSNFYFLNKKQPGKYEKIDFMCIHCGNHIKSYNALTL